MERVKRSYSSPHREAQARRTRLNVLSAARRLFDETGYGSTSLQQIATAAGVSVQTIYASFGTKPAVLADLLDVAIAGDDEPVAVNDRDWMRTVFEHPDAQIRLAAYGEAVAGIYERAGDVFAIVRSAAQSDVDLVPLAETTEQRRRAGAESVTRGLEELGALRDGLDAHRAADILWTLNSPEIHQRLVRECGWTSSQYATWLAATMGHALLDDR